MSLTAPSNTIRLTATPLNANGAPLSGLGVVSYTAGDSTVSVDSTGLVTANFTTSGTFVVARLQDRKLNITHSDTVLIQVTQTPPAAPIDTFTLQPAKDDSAKRALDFGSFLGGTAGSFPWPAHVTDQAGSTLCDTTACSIQVYYTSSNPEVATIDRSTGHVVAIDTGHVVFTATTWAYGVARRDSVAFRIGYQLHFAVMMTLAMVLGVLTLGFKAPKVLILGAGAVVTFCNRNPQQADIVFDQPAAVDTASCQFSRQVFAPPTGSGNISAFGGDTTNTQAAIATDCAVRRFPTPGVYRYHSSLFPSDTFEILIKKE